MTRVAAINWAVAITALTMALAIVAAANVRVLPSGELDESADVFRAEGQVDRYRQLQTPAAQSWNAELVGGLLGASIGASVGGAILQVAASRRFA